MNNKLFELFNLCSEKKIDFLYETDETGKNNIIFQNDNNIKSIKIIISDPEDKNLDQMITNIISQI